MRVACNLTFAQNVKLFTESDFAIFGSESDSEDFEGPLKRSYYRVTVEPFLSHVPPVTSFSFNVQFLTQFWSNFKVSSIAFKGNLFWQRQKTILYRGSYSSWRRRKIFIFFFIFWAPFPFYKITNFLHLKKKALK